MGLDYFTIGQGPDVSTLLTFKATNIYKNQVIITYFTVLNGFVYTYLSHLIV